jgi:hypothetical protein
MALHIVTRRWWFSTIITCVILSAFYIAYAMRSIPRGGSLTGYVLGVLATALLIGLMLLPIRKRQYQRPVGALDIWMRLHVILGVITGLIVFMHAGFKVVGTINIALTVVFVLALFSGMLGTFLYEWYPPIIARMGNDVFRQSVLKEQITALEEELAQVQTAQSEQMNTLIKKVFEHKRVPETLNPIRLWQWRRNKHHTFEQGLDNFSSEEQSSFHGARTLIDHHQNLGRQLFYQHLLRQWLWSHIPLSAALMTLLAVHIVSELYY